MNCWQVRYLNGYLACNTYIKYFIIFIMLYTYATELYTYTNDFYCVNCHNARNLYHIRVIDQIQ